MSYRQSTAISYRLSAKIVIFSKGILNDVDTVSERASSSITPQVLMTTKTKMSVKPTASKRWTESVGETLCLCSLIPMYPH